ncbi:MAG: hypothetical protein IT317_15060 [Anaerolineales bacterium]|nr:hypothetical protein [Anaerolineales bacterium]
MAEIRTYTGTPTLFREGRPAFYGLMWGSAPLPDSYPLHDRARAYAAAGIHLFTFDIGAAGQTPEWAGPGPGREGHFDFSTLAARFQHVLDADPEARFHLRVHLEMPAWWQALYPAEREVLSDGRALAQSFASTLWRAQAKDYLRALVAHLRAAGLFERVIAYQTGAGDTGEWVKGRGAMSTACGDFSPPMQAHFQAWLRRRYQDSEPALRRAWNQPDATFATAGVPSTERQSASSTLTFRDPQREQAIIDYYRCLADLCADLVIDFCGTIKAATRGQALAGAFFGYLLELAWNSAFFAEREEYTNSHISTYQRSGHLGLARVLASPQVDFLVSPYSYGFRGLGGEGPSMLPAESVRLHGKLYLFEDDTRTHLTRHDHPNYGKAATLAESAAILKRNFAYVITHGQGMWWLAGGDPATPHIDPVGEPAFQPLLKRFQELGEFSLHLERAPSAEIAVLVDDESFYYESLRNELDLPLIFQQRLWGLPRLGAPCDTYLLQDFIDGRLPPYKLYLFLNAFRLDQARRRALQRQIQRDQRVAVWVYAPGYIEDDLSAAHMTDLTGFLFGESEIPWGPLMHLTDYRHPITRGLPQDLSWGTNSRLGPVFCLEDDQAVCLGNVVLAQGRCRPGFGVKVFPDWTSIYVAAPNLPAPVLRGLARYAGVHLYNEQGDVLYATRNLLAVHTLAGGERTFRLPRPAEVVYDLFERQTVAEAATHFQVMLPPASTALYYLGDAARLKPPAR